MKCFTAPKPRRRMNGRDAAAAAPAAAVLEEETAAAAAEAAPEGVLSYPTPPPNINYASSTTPIARTFKSRVRAIQNAQRFIIHSHPKLNPSSSSHPGFVPVVHHSAATPFSVSADDLSPIPVPAARSPTELCGRRSSPRTARCAAATDEAETAGGDGHGLHTCSSSSIYMPLPSPVQHQSAYRLPLPAAAAATTSSNSRDRPKTQIGCSVIASSSAPSPSPSSTTASTSLSPPSSSSSSSSSTKEAANDDPVASSSSFSKGTAYHQPSLPLLQPLPLPVSAPSLRHFSQHDLASACLQTCCAAAACGCFAGSLKLSGKSQDVVSLLLLNNLHQGFSEMAREVSSIAHLHGAHFCKLLGFSSSEEHHGGRMLIYEKLHKGSLHSLLFGGAGLPALQWPVRMKIAYGIAQGLAILHDKHPGKVCYGDLRTCHVQLDVDYSPKLSGYRFIQDSDKEAYRCSRPSNPRLNAYAAPETLSKGDVTPKSNVWSYGVILLELLTGKQHMDEAVTRDEKQNLVKWAKPFLTDEGKLFLLMDPKLQGKFPSRWAKMVADLLCQCLQKDSAKRPNMKEVLEVMRCIQEMRYKIARLPAKELVTEGTRFHMSMPMAMHCTENSMAKTNTPTISSASSSTTTTTTTTTSLSSATPSSFRAPTQFDLIESPILRPLIIPRRGCASTFVMEDIVHHYHQPDYQSAPLGHVSGS